MTTFTTIFVTSTSSLLKYLKIKKIEGGKISQPTHPIIFKKSSAVLCIFVQYFSLQITTIISALKFPIFKLQSIITFDLKAVDNFYYHICNKHIKLVNIPENKENRVKYHNPPTHPSTHLPTHYPPNKVFWTFKKSGYYRVKWKCQNTFLDQLPKMDPFGICVGRLPSGDKRCAWCIS